VNQVDPLRQALTARPHFGDEERFEIGEPIDASAFSCALNFMDTPLACSICCLFLKFRIDRPAESEKKTAPKQFRTPGFPGVRLTTDP
jgi:hypothetical protein